MQQLLQGLGCNGCAAGVLGNLNDCRSHARFTFNADAPRPHIMKGDLDPFSEHRYVPTERRSRPVVG